MKTGKPIQNEFAQYIVDAVETDGTLYRQTYRPIILNYAKKKLHGIYDAQKAIKGVMPLVIEGIKKYKPGAEHYYETKFGEVPAAIKQKIAIELVAGMQSEINDLVREASKPKKVGNFAGTFKQSDMSSECWAVQFQGKEACKKCEFRGTNECGGKRIIATGKTSKGKTVPLKKR